MNGSGCRSQCPSSQPAGDLDTDLIVGSHYFLPDPCLLLHHRASLSFGLYQIILFDDRCVCVNNLPSYIVVEWQDVKHVRFLLAVW